MSKIAAEIKCNICKKVYIIKMSPKQFHDIKKGVGHIQDILPNHSADERELIISGTCGTCFDRMFSQEIEVNDHSETDEFSPHDPGIELP